MNKAMANKLISIAERNKNVVIILADLGYKIFREFRSRFPDRCINIGIAESSAIGIAAGLSLCGKTVFIYSMASFITTRCFEQIKIDLCHQNIPVKIIGGNSGITMGSAGATHQAIEDIAIIKSLPNICVIAPGDPVEVQCAIEASMALTSPCYIRITKNGEKPVHDANVSFQIGLAIPVHHGKQIAIISTGNLLNTAIAIKNLALVHNFDIGIYSMHTVKPIDKELIRRLVNKYEIIITLEEHVKGAGLGGEVANVILEYNLPLKLWQYGLPNQYPEIVGDRNYLINQYGLTPEAIYKDILLKIKR